ncbi:single-stranded DNA-binding protein [Leucobacter celer]|uniref:single-stranded DNA-binding protein n=1 Tax=Leucobacter celer TaxID=668625 RepID=UPI0006A7E299|nr:single-stranded DNA-binding protein [Leucobacter celer]
MSTPICIIGTVATDPRFSRTNSGAAFCSFRVASNERRYDREQAQWVDGETNWFTVNAFRGLAEHASESFSKGDRVVVSGRLRMRRWESGEKSGTAVEVESDALGHDLRWGVSRFTKRSGADASATAESASPAEIQGAASPADPTGGITSGEQSAWVTAPSEGQSPSSDTDDEGDGFVPVAA